MTQKDMDNDVSQIRKILRAVFGTDQYTEIERLGGLTNHSYKIRLTNNEYYVVRIPGEGTEELIDRKNEFTSTKLACELGIDTKLLYFGANGEKVSQYIENAYTLDAAHVKFDENLNQVALILRTLHTSGRDTKVPFEVFEMVRDYERIIKSNSVALFDDYEQTKSLIMTIKDVVDRDGCNRYVPCHNDPLCENWVSDGNGRLYLIDWEYAGMNDGMWDLADVSIEAGLTTDEDASLLSYYFGRVPDDKEIKRFLANKLYLDLLWSLWGKTRVPFSGGAMDDYAMKRYLRLKENLAAFAEVFSIKER